MVEKRQIVDGLRLNYEGVFDVIEFYDAVEDWIVKKGMDKEIKKKGEHVKATGKDIEWFIEIWKMPTDYSKIIIRLRVLMSNVKEVEIKRGKDKLILNQGNVLCQFDGFIEQDIIGRWQQKPMYYFIRALYDKFLFRLWTDKFNKDVYAGCYELHKVLADFFKRYQA